MRSRERKRRQQVITLITIWLRLLNHARGPSEVVRVVLHVDFDSGARGKLPRKGPAVCRDRGLSVRLAERLVVLWPPLCPVKRPRFRWDRATNEARQGRRIREYALSLERSVGSVQLGCVQFLHVMFSDRYSMTSKESPRDSKTFIDTLWRLANDMKM